MRRKRLRAAARANSPQRPRAERRLLRTLQELRSRAAELLHTNDGEPVDVLRGPTVPCTAIWLDGAGEASSRRAFGGRSRLTRPYGGTGLPAISVPYGFTSRGLPIGVQIAGRPFAEADVLWVAHAYEQATDWHQRRPAIVLGRTGAPLALG